MLRCAAFSMLVLSLVGCTLIGGEALTLTPTPSLPTIEFLFPANNAQVFEGTDLTIDLIARDESGGIGRVELFIDALSDAEPYREVIPVEIAPEVFRVEMNWLARGVGRHQFTAKAYRTDDTPSDETTINIEVIPRTTPTP